MFTVLRPRPSRRLRTGAALLAALLPLSAGTALLLGGQQTVVQVSESPDLLVVFEEQAPRPAPGPAIARPPGAIQEAPRQPAPDTSPEPPPAPQEPSADDTPTAAPSDGVAALDPGAGAPGGGGGGGGCEGPDCDPSGCTGPGCDEAPGPRAVHWSAVKVRRQVQPVMPPAARALGPHQATCVVRMTIDTRGRVTAVDPVDCPVLFQASTVDAAMKWRFEPMRVDGQALDASFLLSVRYDVK